MDRHRLVEARTVVADAEEDELAEVLLSGVVFERSHPEEDARSEAGTLPWAVGTIAAFAHDDLSASETEVPSPAQVYHATRVAIRSCVPRDRPRTVRRSLLRHEAAVGACTAAVGGKLT